MDSEARKKYDDSLIEKELATEELSKKKELLAEDHLMSAKTAKRRGDNMLAMRFIRGCISLDPGRAVYYREMAQLLAENKTWRKEALSFYHRAYHLDQKNLDLLIDVADLANQLSLDGFAVRALKQVTKLDPSNTRAKHLMRKIECQQVTGSRYARFLLHFRPKSEKGDRKTIHLSECCFYPLFER